MIPFIESAKDEILAKIDALKTTIDRLISSSQGSNPNIALGNLSNKIDALKQDVGTKSSQVTVNKVGQDLNNIASTITSKIDTVESKVNQTNTTLATKANQDSVNTLQNTANNIYSKIAAGVVKRVQRGELYSDDIHKLFRVKSKPKGSIGSIVSECVVNLPYAVNVSKSIILCNFVSTGLGSGAQTPNVGCALNNATINLYMANYNYFFANDQYYIINWQVIEFY
nr:MAG TPA: hypothetical protein [Caudoviricetes sp.]